MGQAFKQKQTKKSGGRKKLSPDKQKLDDELTKALKDTFPASDPVSITQPSHSLEDKNSI